MTKTKQNPNNLRCKFVQIDKILFPLDHRKYSIHNFAFDIV